MTNGFIGTGSMGQPMAGRMLDAGHRLVVLDTREGAMRPLLERQAARGTSPKDVADRAETVFLSLPTLKSFRAVALGEDGILHGSAIKTCVSLCTVGGSFAREMEAGLAAKGIEFVDCPISGGAPGAAAGTLSVMVSGRRETVAALRDRLECFGTVFYAGEKVGQAQSLKLVNNILSAVALCATSEAFVMGAKAGLDPEVMVEAVNAGTGFNHATKVKFPRDVLTRNFAYGGTMEILMKDIDLAMKEGEELGVPMWVCHAARHLLQSVVYQGAGPDDLTTLVKYVERGANCEIPKTR